MKKLVSALLITIFLFSLGINSSAVATVEENTVISTDSTVTTESTNPTEPTELTELTELTDSTELTESTEPTEPAESTEPTEPEDVYNGEAGKNLKFSFNEKNGTLSIYGEGTEMNNYKKGQGPWYSFSNMVKTVNLSKANKLEKIGDYSFCDMENLISVDYPDSVKTIGISAFMGDKCLKKFVVGKKVVNIQKDCFKDSGLKSIEFKGKNTKLFDSKNTLPQSAKISTYNPSNAYSYAKKYKRSKYVYLGKIKLSDDNEILMEGEKFSCKVEYKPADATSKGVKYKSSNPKIASVNSDGVVKAKNKGICYISVTSSINNKIKAKDKLKIIVTDYKFTKSFLTRNNCYKDGMAIDPKGIVVHSTGCNNPNAYSYIRNWNYPTPGGREVCVHGFLGKNPNGAVQFYQALPFEMACWGVGQGSKGSYNYYPGYIQFECCEDSTYNPSYFYTIYDEATDLCAYLCLKYNLPVERVVSHREACLLGYGSAHGDIDHWLFRYGLTMSDFRKTVKSKIYKIDPKPDLTSGNKYKKVTVKRDTYIRKNMIVDDYGTSGKVLEAIKKNSCVKFIRDRRGGWSYVQTETGKKGYILNEDLQLEYKSKFFMGVAPSTLKMYSASSKKPKYYVKTVPKGAKVQFVSQIKEGSKKGWAYIKYNGQYGYVYSTIPYNDD